MHEHSAKSFAPRPAKLFLPAGDRVDNKYKPSHITRLVDWASGKLIKVINVSNLLDTEMSPKIERCEYLTSYNWFDHPKHPIILVPGMYSLLIKREKINTGDIFRVTTALVTVTKHKAAR